MPSRTIHVQIYKAAPAEAVSQLMSYIAYPDPLDNTERERFATALCRLAIVERATAEKEWGQTIQQIKPHILLEDEKTFLDSLRRGTKLLGRHLITAGTFLTPHMIAISKGSKAPLWGGFDPTVENLSTLVMDALGWKGDSSSTVKSRLWRVTKPIAHLGYVFVASLSVEAMVAKKQNRDPSRIFYELFFSDMLPVYLQMAENCRKKLGSIKQFKIKEEETIQFLAC